MNPNRHSTTRKHRNYFGWIAAFAIAAVLSFVWPEAKANGTTPTPTPTPVATSNPIKNHVANTNSNNAAAGAISGSRSGARSNATGGTSTAAGGNSDAISGSTSSATSGNSGDSAATGIGGPSSASTSGTNSVGGDQSNTSVRGYVLPPLVFTPPLPVTCPNAQVSNTAVGVLFGAGSYANGETDPSDCTLLAISARWAERCSVLSAKNLEDEIVKKYLPNWKPEPSTATDLDLVACAELKRARAEFGPLQASQGQQSTTVVNVNTDNVGIVPTAKIADEIPVQPTPKAERPKNPKPKAKAKPPCPEGQKLVCRPTT